MLLIERPGAIWWLEAAVAHLWGSNGFIVDWRDGGSLCEQDQCVIPQRPNYRMERTVTDKVPSSGVGATGAHAGR